MRWCACAAGVWLCALTLAAADDTAPKGENEVATPGVSPHSDKQSWHDDDTALMSKRGWQDLNSAWGKRGWQDLNSAWGKRGWQDLNSAWGKRGWQDLNPAWGKRDLQDITEEDKREWRDLSQAWGKRGWQDLNSAWGKRSTRDLLKEYRDSNDIAMDPIDYEDMTSAKRGWNDMSMAGWGKRGWQDLNSAWGKRGWQDLNSAWGKRGWQDLNSAWGKRKPEQKWSNFHGSWGKRSDDYSSILRSPAHSITLQQLMNEQPARGAGDKVGAWAPERDWSDLHAAWVKRIVKHPYHAGAYYWKREPGWTNLRGMWGKRSAALGALASGAPAPHDDGSAWKNTRATSRQRAPISLLPAVAPYKQTATKDVYKPEIAKYKCQKPPERFKPKPVIPVLVSKLPFNLTLDTIQVFVPSRRVTRSTKLRPRLRNKKRNAHAAKHKHKNTLPKHSSHRQNRKSEQKQRNSEQKQRNSEQKQRKSKQKQSYVKESKKQSKSSKTNPRPHHNDKRNSKHKPNQKIRPALRKQR